MKIIKSSADPQAQATSRWWFIALLALGAGLLLGNAGVLASLQDVWSSAIARWTQPNEGGSLPVLALDVNFENYSGLLRQREKALAGGILFDEDADFYPAAIQADNEEIPIRIRLLPGAARQLNDGEKWNFEIETRDNRELFGQTRLNLIDPADNNWLGEWAFMRALQHEQLPAAGYDFAQLFLNGENRGIYALQEAFASILPAAEERPQQVIVAYDTGPLWEAVSYFGGDTAAAAADPVTNFATNDLRFVAIEDSRDPLVNDDELLRAQMERAQTLLLGLQRGDLAAAQVFDVEQYGRFLALADLFGAPAALSPFNLRYAYDAGSDRLSPIGINGDALAEDARIPLAAAYQDPQLQAAYAAAAAYYGAPAFLADLQAALDPELQPLSQAVGVNGNRDELWATLAERQSRLRRSLQPAQPVIAQLGPPERAQEAIIEVNVANAINLPLEILGFDIDGATFLDMNPAWLTAGAEYVSGEDGRIVLPPVSGEAPRRLNFVTFELPVTEIIKQDRELDFLNEIEVQVATRVLGLEETQLTPAAAGPRTTPAVPATAVP
jgi:hypothetical protein